MYINYIETIHERIKNNFQFIKLQMQYLFSKIR